MVGKQVELSVPVQIDADIFRDFAAFDVLQRQKRWRRPLVFALAMLVFAVICFAQAGRRPGAGGVLVVLQEFVQCIHQDTGVRGHHPRLRGDGLVGLGGSHRGHGKAHHHGFDE